MPRPTSLSWSLLPPKVVALLVTNQGERGSCTIVQKPSVGFSPTKDNLVEFCSENQIHDIQSQALYFHALQEAGNREGCQCSPLTPCILENVRDPSLEKKFFLHFKLFLIEFIGVTLVMTIIQVSVKQFYNASSACCIVCSPPQVLSIFFFEDTCF